MKNKTPWPHYTFDTFTSEIRPYNPHLKQCMLTVDGD